MTSDGILHEKKKLELFLDICVFLCGLITGYKWEGRSWKTMMSCFLGEHFKPLFDSEKRVHERE